MNVEIWSDVVCPWCYIGKRRFESALAQFPHRDEVTVTWRSFELDPNAPQTYPGTLNERLARKLGVPVHEAARMNARVSGIAAGEGLEYHLDQARPSNTFDAHRLIHFGAARGIQDAVKERLMRAYFTDGLPIGETETLISLAVEAGLEAGEARAALESDTYAEDVRADEHRAAEFGIRSVPFVVLDEQFGVSGAQPAELFLSALQTAWKAAHPLTIIGGTDASDASESAVGASACEDDSCAN
jgi:predicted DsbA family dithiol-disulfide isomerase